MPKKFPWTAEHLRVLKWLNENLSYAAEWRTGNKPATGSPATFSHFRITARGSRITIRKVVWIELGKYIRSCDWTESRMFVPNARGLRLMREIERRLT